MGGQSLSFRAVLRRQVLQSYKGAAAMGYSE